MSNTHTICQRTNNDRWVHTPLDVFKQQRETSNLRRCCSSCANPCCTSRHFRDSDTFCSRLDCPMRSSSKSDVSVCREAMELALAALAVVGWVLALLLGLPLVLAMKPKICSQS